MSLILAVNAGSSSLKLSLFARAAAAAADAPVSLLAAAAVADIGAPTAAFAYNQHTSARAVADHAAAFQLCLDALFADGHSAHDVSHVCHRVVHGGDFTDPVVLEPHTLARLDALSDLAPLHNDRALAIVRAAQHLLPRATAVAFFDSAFHRTLPPHIYTYPIAPAVAAHKHLRKYGFHGISYAFILRAVAAFLRKPPAQTSLIALHLGAGASACAIRNGASVNVSMGLTPLSGLPGATRSGDVDPSLIFHYTADAAHMSRAAAQSMHVSQAEHILNTQAGWKALTGTADFRAIAAPDAAPAHRLAFDLVVDRVAGYIGAYYVQLGGQVDALVFAGGIGEHSHALRGAVAQRVACLGFAPVAAAPPDGTHGTVVDVGTGAGTRTLVCRTDEQLEIARECALNGAFWA